MKLLLFMALLLAAPVFAKTCGLTGTVDERIKGCAEAKGHFHLVSRTDKKLEIYKDLKTGLLWGDRIGYDFNHYGSQKACEGVAEAEILKGVRWRLPTLQDFQAASQNGLKTALPNLSHWFWTSTPIQAKRKYRRRRAVPSSAFLWHGEEQSSSPGDLKDGASVRCVARE